jgi:hypothetical protein
MDGYDLQDTLVKIDYSGAFGERQLIANIAEAKVIYTPSGDFVVVTAQQDNPQIHAAIKHMINEKFPNCQGVYFVSGGEHTVAIKKAASIKRLNLKSFTDNNRNILATIKELLPTVSLFVMTSTGRKKY